MSETHKNYRIRTDIGSNIKNKYITIDANLLQDYDTFDILSVKIDSVDTYKLHNANYGVVVGRVLANNGFGIPNAKISVFIKSDGKDGDSLREIYPFFTTSSKNKDGVRYNLLPDEKVADCHQIVGTFPNKRYALDNDVILEVFDKYYKYTTRTNNSGDYLLMGIPVGAQTLHMDLDLSDCGILSQRPRDFVYKGYTIEQFENPNMFKSGNAYSNLSQIFSQDQVINVQPFWGDSSIGEKIGITRADIDVSFKFEPTCVFIGSVISDNSSQGISKKCIPTENMGNMEEMNTGEGTIEMIRKTPDGDVEEFQVKGTQLINGDGVWCYQIPMNLDYVITDEYGNLMPTDDVTRGIPTRTRVRFRVSMQDNEENIDNYFRPKVLVPHNPQNLSDDKHEAYDYEFGTYTNDNSFRDLFWNNVYSVKSYIPRFQKKQVLGWKEKKFTGIKNCNFYGSNNPMPYNNIRIKLPFMFTIMCALTKIIILIVSVINYVIAVLGDIMANVGNTWIFGYHLDFAYEKALNLRLNVLKEGLCPDLENWYFAPILKRDSIQGELNGRHKPPHKHWNRYNLIKQTLNGLHETGADDDASSLDSKNNEEQINGETICLTTDTTYLISCIEMNLAMEYRVINFDFYNDWINGTIYVPRFMRYVRPKKTFLGAQISPSKIKGCMDDPSIYSTARRYTQQCAMGFKSQSVGGKIAFTNVEKPRLNTDADIRKANNLHKKRGFTQKSIFGSNGGICHDQTTLRGQHVYYLKPCEWVDAEDHAKYVKVNLFATDIILLGSLNDKDNSGIPQAFKYLSSTSYIMPTNLALTNMETAGSLYTTNGGTVCTGKKTNTGPLGTNSNVNIGIQRADSNISLSQELKAYSGTGNSNYDVQYESGELSDLVALTEAAGISWNFTGPGQGKMNDANMYYPGGHFLGLSCVNSQTNIKSCINLSRICEVGANMSQRKEDISSLNKYGEIEYTYTAPSGFISGDDIVGANFRTMFATLNYKRLLATKTNPITGYKMYDFDFLKPINFDGSFVSLVEGNSLYNGMVSVPKEDENFLQKLGIGRPDEHQDYDPNENVNTQIRTIEDTSIDYYLFRMGLDYEDLKKNNNKHLRKFLGKVDGKLYLPQYENSYYFYFGLKNGATAIDEFNKQYFSVCENGVLLNREATFNVSVDDLKICEGTADVSIMVSNLEMPYAFIEYYSDENPIPTVITNGSPNEKFLQSYSFVFTDLPWGTYYFKIQDANNIIVNKTISVGTDILTYSVESHDYNTSSDERGKGGGLIEEGGYITVSNVYVNGLKTDIDITVSTPSGSSAVFKNGEEKSVNIKVHNSGEHYLYATYKCSNQPLTIFMQKVNIKNGSDVLLLFNDNINHSITQTQYAPSTKWWSKNNVGNNEKWINRICLFNEVPLEDRGKEAIETLITARGGTKVIWGLPQNNEEIKIGEIYCNENIFNIPEGYTLDDEYTYWPTYKYSGTEITHYSMLATKGNIVMGDYDAYIGGKLTSTAMTNGYGYIFKPLPDGDLQYGVYNNGYTYDDLNGTITNGVFYPSVAMPIFDRPFDAKARFYIWQEKELVKTTRTGTETIEEANVEKAGKSEVIVYNGITFDNQFFSSSTISNLDGILKVKENDMYGISNNTNRITVFSGFTDSPKSVSYGYEIIGNFPSLEYEDVVSRISDSIKSEFGDYITYNVDESGNILSLSVFSSTTDNAIAYFMCAQPYDEDSILSETVEKYVYTGDVSGHLLCKYTDQAIYNIEGSSVIVSYSYFMAYIVVRYNLINENGIEYVKTKTILLKDEAVDILQSPPKERIKMIFDVIFRECTDIVGVKQYVINKSGPYSTSSWEDIILEHKDRVDKKRYNPFLDKIYAVGVISESTNFKDEKTVLYKIYTTPIKVASLKDIEDVVIELSTSDLTYGSNGGEQTIIVKGGKTRSWFTHSSNEWITITPSKNTGLETTVVIKVEKLNNDTYREGYIDFYLNEVGDGARLIIKQNKSDIESYLYEVSESTNGVVLNGNQITKSTTIYRATYDKTPYEIVITPPNVTVTKLDENTTLKFTLTAEGETATLVITEVGTYAFTPIKISKPSKNLSLTYKCDINNETTKSGISKFEYKFAENAGIIVKK